MKKAYVLLAAMMLSIFFIECASNQRPPEQKEKTKDTLNEEEEEYDKVVTLEKEMKEEQSKRNSEMTESVAKKKKLGTITAIDQNKVRIAGQGKEIYKKKETVDYEDVMLEGKLKKPSAVPDSYTLDRPKSTFNSMINIPKGELSGSDDPRRSIADRKRKEDSGDASASGPEESADEPAKIEKRSRPIESGGLKAGYSDDNKQFNYFIRFLKENKGPTQHIAIFVNERIVIKVSDKNGKSIPNAEVIITSKNRPLETGRTMADGTFLFFPAEYDTELKEYQVRVISGNNKKELSFQRHGAREIPVILDTERPKFGSVPLDIVFVLDTTGSMGEEISRLKATIELINMNIANFTPKPKVRFGMVLYRDISDEYVTRVIPLTNNLDTFNSELSKVEAAGGGDTPEDLQTALNDSLNEIDWNLNGVRLAFIITDAPPHLDYAQKNNYALSVTEAKRKAIKYFSIGTGGLDLSGEYVLRQIAQYTSGKYIFLNYGEKGDSEGGAPGSVSHHIGSNYQTDKLEAIVINIAREEIGNLSETVAAPPDEYFKADKIETEKNADTLQKLFDRALSQLEDYSSLAFSTKLPTAVMPIDDKGGGSKIACEFFTEQAAFSLSRSRFFKPLERMDLQKVMTELSLNQTTVASEENAAKVGKLLGAKAIIIGNSFKESGYYHIFLKLVDSETGVILSMTKLVIDEKLGVK